uniref:Uncharacterized protein n=1 Tax=Salix viminalis TaxID=40686 RepID=A0A6N2LQB9_SALVM
MDRSHAFPQCFNESPPSTCFCTGFPSPTVTMAREENQILDCAADFPVQSCYRESEQGIQNNHRTESGRPSSTDQSHEVSLHIVEIATLRKLLETKKVFSPACCIYRVPARLRELNEKAYTPRVVSIGPLHHGKENLKAMDDHKIMYMQQFLERSEVSVEDLINVVKVKETELRICYEETIDLSREDFATMILLDAVFVIMVLLKFDDVGESGEIESGDQIFSRPFKIEDVMFDRI